MENIVFRTFPEWICCICEHLVRKQLMFYPTNDLTVILIIYPNCFLCSAKIDYWPPQVLTTCQEFPGCPSFLKRFRCIFLVLHRKPLASVACHRTKEALIYARLYYCFPGWPIEWVKKSERTMKWITKAAVWTLIEFLYFYSSSLFVHVVLQVVTCKQR